MKSFTEKSQISFFLPGIFLLLLISANLTIAQSPTNEGLPLPDFDKEVPIVAAENPEKKCFDYRLPLEQGEYFRLSAQQKGVDVGLQFYDLENKPLYNFDIDSPNNTIGDEFFVYYAEKAGNYKLQICYKEKYSGGFILSKNNLADNEKTLEFVGKIKQAEEFFDKGENSNSFKDRLDGYEEARNIYLNLPKPESKWRKYRRGLIAYQLGGLYAEFDKQNSAAEEFEKAVKLAQEIQDSSLESWALNDLGLAYYRLGKYETAENVLQNAVALLETFQENCQPTKKENCFARQLANSYSRYSLVLSLRGENEKALEFTQKALGIFRETPDFLKAKKDLRFDWDKSLVSIIIAEPTILTNAGLVYAAQGKRQEALEFLKNAKKLFDKPESKAKDLDKIHVRNILANIYESLANIENAEQNFNEALKLAEKLEETQREFEEAIINTGKGRLKMKPNPDEALKIFEKTASQFEKLNKIDYQAIVINFIGQTFHYKKDYQNALKNYEKAKTLRDTNKIGNNLDYGQLLNNIGAAYFESGKKASALKYYQDALQFHLANGLRTSEAETYHNLMIYYKFAGQNGLAIFYGKLAINEYQSLRTDIRALDLNIRRGYLSSIEDTYRILEFLLIEEKRYVEFERVNYLLKEEEFSQFTEKGSPQVDVGEKIGWLSNELKLYNDYKKTIEDLEKINRELKDLENKKPRTAVEEKRYQQLKIASEKLKKEIFSKPQTVFSTNNKISRIDPANNPKFLRSLVNKANGTAVGIYVELSPLNELAVCLVANGQELVCRLDKKTFSLEKAVKLVSGFNDTLQTANRIGTNETTIQAAQAKGRKFYEIIIKPIEEELRAAKNNGANTIFWSLSAVFRYVPVAAIYTPQDKYLVEDFANVVMRDLGRQNRRENSGEGKVLALGTTKQYLDFSALPQDKDEVCNIIRADFCAEYEQKNKKHLFAGKIYFDENFLSSYIKSPQDLIAADNFFSLLISTHFKYGTTVSDSKLLTGDKAQNYLVSLKEISDEADFSSLETVVFSACETAKNVNDNNGKEIEGLGFLAQSKGAKAVLSTIYTIPAGGASVLVATFYCLKKQNPALSNARLLQLAQLRLLNEDAFNEILKKESLDNCDFLPLIESTKEKIANKTYQHPYFWSGFLMVDSIE